MDGHAELLLGGGERRSERSQRVGVGRPAPAAQAGVLALQRSAGNAAVAKMLAVENATPVSPAEPARLQRVPWGLIGLVTGGVMGMALGGVPGAIAGAGIGAVAGAMFGSRRAPAPDPLADLKSEAGLALFQQEAGGNTQGTLALFLAAGRHYMLEQQTSNRIKEAAENRGIEYIGQTRVPGLHAEPRVVQWAKKHGSSLVGATIWVSKKVCADCADLLTREGVTMATPHDAPGAARYHNWRTAEGLDPEPRRPVGVYKGRKSEPERLRESASAIKW